MKRLYALSIAMSFLTFLGCDDSNSPSQNTPTLTVTIDQTPQTPFTTRYNWTSGNISILTVARTSDRSTPLWQIRTTDGDNIASGVAHGIVPTGASETVDIETSLTSGIEYVVTIEKFNGDFGETTFTEP